jgi:hypothetical protein
VHIGADVLTHPRHARWARPLSCRDTTARLSRLCQAAGIATQQTLLGPHATTGQVRAALPGTAASTGPGGLLVVSFSGHSERPVPGEHGGGWCLHDAVLRHAQTAALLAAAPASAHIIIIADTCYAATCAAAFTPLPATTVVLAACAGHQATLNYEHSQFVTRLEQLAYPGGRPNPDCASYAWLRRELRKDTPDVERPEVHASPPAAMHQRPFQPAPPVTALTPAAPVRPA